MKNIDQRIGYAINNNDDESLLTKGIEAYMIEDYETAFKLYTVSSVMGHPLATNNLGYCYLYGRGIKKDIEMGIHILKLSASKGIVEANYKLGSIYYFGFEGVKKDKDLGKYYLDKAWQIMKMRDMDDIDFPQVCYARAKIFMGNKKKFREDEVLSIVDMLLLARIGFVEEIKNGMKYHQEYLNEVLELLKRPDFAKAAKKFEEMIERDLGDMIPEDFGKFVQ